MKQPFVPIYRKLSDQYRKSIENQAYPPGSKIDSIQQIMSRHHVSRETAKLVLRQLLDEGLIISKQGKGSFVVDHEETKPVWGMVIPFYSSNMETLIEHLSAEASARGRDFEYYLGYNNPEEEQRLVRNMILHAYEAIIVVPNYDENLTASFYRNLVQGRTQVILADYTMSGSYFRYVVQSYDLGVCRALEYLAAEREGNLLMVKNESWKGRNLLIELVEQSLRIRTSNDYPGKKVFVIPDVRQLNKSLLSENDISGILCYSDIDAIKTTGRLKQWNISMPDDVRLVSYGNTELTRFHEPEITVIDCMYGEMASRTAALIDDGDDKGREFEQHIIQPVLIKRGT